MLVQSRRLTYVKLLVEIHIQELLRIKGRLSMLLALQQIEDLKDFTQVMLDIEVNIRSLFS